MPNRMLIWGQQDFISQAFFERVVECCHAEITLANFADAVPQSTIVKKVQCDRENAEDCRRILNAEHWTWVVDFSAWNHFHIENTVENCRFDHYTFLSGSVVDLSWPHDELFGLAQNKLWCEHLLQGATKKLLTVRPGYVVSEADGSGRFENRGSIWYWKGSQDPVQPVIHVRFLTGLMVELILKKHTGVVRAGYSVPRVSQANSQQTL